MVAPISGPISKVHTNSGGHGVGVYKTSDIYRQKKPYNLRLPYKMLKSVCYSYKNWTVPTGIRFQGGGASVFGGYRPVDLVINYGDATLATLRNQALTNAWDKLNGEISDSAEWMVTLLQRQQSIDAATARAYQFARFVNALRKGRFGDAAAALHIDARDPKVQQAERRAHKWLSGRNRTQEKLYGDDNRFSNLDKRIGGAVLEYNFGWAPTIGDIYNTASLLSSSWPTATVKGKGKASTVVKVNVVNGHETVVGSYTYHMKAALAGDMVCENPNLFLASRLGLLNPAIIVYEMTPWSFVGNWFLNLETMIRAYSPQWGFRWENATTTFSLYSDSDVSGTAYNGSKAFAKQSRFSQIRTTGLKKPRLGFRPQKLVLSRLANAVSLVLQRLRK